MAPGKTAGVTLARVYPASIGFRLLVGLLDAAPQTCKHGGDVEPYLRTVGAEDHVVRSAAVLPGAMPTLAVGMFCFWPKNGKLETFRVFRRLKVNEKPQDPVTRRISSESNYTKTAGECQEAD